MTQFETGILGAMLSGSIAPLVVLAIAAAAFSNEVEDNTLANLSLSPLPRWQIIVPKFLAAITIAGPFIGASAFATSYIAFLGDPKAVFAVTVSALVGVILYAAAFLWLGLMTTYAIGIGLLYIVLWEGFFSGFVTGVRMLSIRHYAISLMIGFLKDATGGNTGAFLGLAVFGLGIFVVFSLLNYTAFANPSRRIGSLRPVDKPDLLPDLS